MNHTEKTIPVWKKYSLNVSEAAEYYGIGEKRLRQIAGENEGADFILEFGIQQGFRFLHFHTCNRFSFACAVMNVSLFRFISSDVKPQE